MLGLAEEFGRPGLAVLAPQAAGHSWYPYHFLEPVPTNEPWLSSALLLVGEVLGSLVAEGIPATRTALLGFSQGGCLALEFAARNPRKYGGVVGLSAGLIGKDPGPYPHGLEGTTVFLGCGVPDPHIPEERVRLSEQILRAAGADVTMRLYPGIGHTVNADELNVVRGIVDGVLANNRTTTTTTGTHDCAPLPRIGT
jgi:predicted esterase